MPHVHDPLPPICNHAGPHGVDPEPAIVRIAPNNPVFDRRSSSGIEEGLFTKAGLDVSFSATYADREKDRVGPAIMSRLKEQLFDCGSADSYNVCEWASIDRLERGNRGGNIAALRAAVAAQAILSFDEALQVPRDLADVPVMVAGAPRLALHHAADARKRGRGRPREDRAWRACRRCAGPRCKIVPPGPSQ